MKNIIKRSDIVDTITVCPYCMRELREPWQGCCGESSAHQETAYVTQDDQCYLDSEITIEEDT
jgi:hypothetical protein